VGSSLFTESTRTSHTGRGMQVLSVEKEPQTVTTELVVSPEDAFNAKSSACRAYGPRIDAAFQSNGCWASGDN